MKGAGLADVARVDAAWRRGQTTMDPGMRSDLRDGIDKAQAAGIDVYLSLYPDGSSQTPITDRDRATSRPGSSTRSRRCPISGT